MTMHGTLANMREDISGSQSSINKPSCFVRKVAHADQHLAPLSTMLSNIHVKPRAESLLILSWEIFHIPFTLTLLTYLALGLVACRDNESGDTRSATHHSVLGSVLSGTWHYRPPKELWPNESFKLVLQQRGEQLVGHFKSDGTGESKAIEQQSLHGTLTGNLIVLDVRLGAAILATLSGNVSEDKRSIVGRITYINQPPMVWSASR